MDLDLTEEGESKLWSYKFQDRHSLLCDELRRKYTKYREDFMGKRGPKATPRAKVIAETADYLSSAKRGLTANERKEWDKTVRCKTPGFYREDDVQLLKKYCRTISMSELYDIELQTALVSNNLERADWFSKRWEKSVTLLESLCRMLKIGPSTRETHRNTAKATEVGLPAKKSSRAGLMYGGQAPGQSEKVLN